MRPERARHLRARLRMVRRLHAEGRLHGLRHAGAMLRVPRHAFAPHDAPRDAYEDGSLDVGEDQTLSCPHFVAMMTGLLQLRRGDRVLEVGTGTGYQAAVLAAIGAEVTSIEIRPRLHAMARDNHAQLGIRGVDFRLGDGSQGAPDRAPFHGIVLACVPEEIPPTLLQQLAIGGRLVGPEGDPSRIQTLVHIERTPTGFSRQELRSAWFVPLVGPDDLD